MYTETLDTKNSFQSIFIYFTLYKKTEFVIDECCKLAQKISFMHAIDQFQDFHYLFRKQTINTKEPENLYIIALYWG
jgi:hypothetical protein